MKNKINSKISFRYLSLMVLAAAFIVSPALSLAATYAYVNQSGNIATVEASTPMLAIATAPNIDAHSGVIPLSNLTAIGTSVNIVSTNSFSPTIKDISVNTSGNSATINWNTTMTAGALVYYSTSPITMVEASVNSGVVISGTSFLVHADPRTSHQASLTGLMSDTTYYYVLYVKDTMGKESITWPSTFRTNN